MRRLGWLVAPALGALAMSCSGSGSGSGAPDAGCPGPAFDGGPLDPALVQTGQNLVQQWQCQQCHGDTLEGNDDGVSIPYTSRTQYPPNLTPDPATGLGCWTNDQVENAILNGLDNNDTPICGPMPHFSALGLTQSDAAAIVAYLRSLPAFQNNPPSGPACGCSTDCDCPPGQSCLDGGWCSCLSLGCAIPAFSDGGVPEGCDAGVDAGIADAGHDGGVEDAGRDGGLEDGGRRDGGVDAGLDAGTGDAGPGDAGIVDAGFDAGLEDAGTDAGFVDAGPDAGVEDAGLDEGVDAGLRDAGGDAG